MHKTLARVELFLGCDSAGGQEHTDQHVQQRGRWRDRFGPVHCPFVYDTDNEIAKDRLQENHLRNEIGVNIKWSLEAYVVRDLQAQ